MKTVVICTTETNRTERWGIELAKLLECEFSDLGRLTELETLEVTAKKESADPRVFFARDMANIAPELAANSINIFLVEPPADYLCRSMLQDGTSSKGHVENWVEQTESALHVFQQARTKTSLLLTLDDLIERNNETKAALGELGLNLGNLPALSPSAADPALRLLAELLVEKHGLCRNLYEEVLAASSIIRSGEEFRLDVDKHAALITSDLQSRREAATSQTNLVKTLDSSQYQPDLAQLQLDQIHKELESTYSQVETLQNDYKVAQAEIKKLQHDLAGKPACRAGQDKSESNYKVSVRSLDVNAELELALLQVSQLQEELEIYYSKYPEGSHQARLALSGEALGSNTQRLLRLARVKRGTSCSV